MSFSEFVSWVHQGQVPDVHVKDREFSFTHVTDGKSVNMDTLGPNARRRRSSSRPRETIPAQQRR